MHINALGLQGEELICSLLTKKNFTIIEKNYASRTGEIDIIAKQENLLAFIEVKTRKTAYFAVSTVVNKTKQRKIIKTALHFLARNPHPDTIIRFDIATVIMNDTSHEIHYIPNAFTQAC